MMDYWQKLSKRFAIKITLPHLFLGVLAAAFSLSSPSVLSVNQSPSTSITIAAVMINLHEHQSDNQIESACIIHHEQKSTTDIPFLSVQSDQPIVVVRLTPDNGIRAGPLFA